MKRMFYVQLNQCKQIFALPLNSLLYNGASNARGIVPIGRTAVSKTDGWGFESLCPCQYFSVKQCFTGSVLLVKQVKVK